MDWRIYLKIKYDGTNWTDVFTGISSGTMKLDRSIVQGDIVYGNMYSAMFACQLYATEYDLAGLEIRVVKRVTDDNDNNTDTNIFTGKIDSSTTDYSGLYRDIVAYDMFYYLRSQNLVDWWENFWDNAVGDVTVKDLREAVVTEVGLTPVSRTLTNDNVVLNGDSLKGAYTQITFEDILHAVSEITATFPVIDGDGNVDWIFFHKDSNYDGTGKNLLKVTATSDEVNGVTFTVNGNGTVTADGTASSNIEFVLGSVSYDSRLSYYLNGCPAGGSSSTYCLYSGETDSGNGAVITPGSSGSANVSIKIASGTQVENLLFKPMVMVIISAMESPNGNVNLSGVTASGNGNVRLFGEGLTANELNENVTLYMDTSFEPYNDGYIVIETDMIETASAVYEDFVTAKITEVTVLDTQKNIVFSYGNDNTNPFSIVGNFILNSMTTAEMEPICAAILNKIKDLQYYPYDIKMIYTDWNIELGVAVMIPRGLSYCMGYEMSGIQLIEEEVRAVASAEVQSVVTYDYNQVLAEARRYSKIEQNIDGIVLEVGTLDEELNQYNMLPVEYNRESISGGEYTSNGVTWTVGEDGSITADTGIDEVSGLPIPSSGQSTYTITASTTTGTVPVIELDETKTYFLSGCPSGGSESTFALRARVTPSGTTPSASSGTLYSDFGSGVSFTGGKYVYVYAVVQANVAVTEKQFFPQLEEGRKRAYQPTRGYSSSVMTRITQTEQDVSTIIEDVGGLQTVIREYSGGVLVCKTGNSIGALVNANGSFDVVAVTWSGTTPTAGRVYWSGASTGTNIYDSNGNLIGNFSGSGITLGNTNLGYTFVDSTGVKVYRSGGGLIADLGSGQVIDSGGSTSTGIYNTLGSRDDSEDIGDFSVAAGDYVVASGYASFAEGAATQATGMMSHAEGDHTEAGWTGAHAEGGYTVATGLYDHVEGYQSSTGTSGANHAEGYQTSAVGGGSHAEGSTTTASGAVSHAEGYHTTASGARSHAGGYDTIAQGDNQTAIGKFNVADSTSLLIVGNGTADDARSNALKLDASGNLTIAGGLTASNVGTRITESDTTGTSVPTATVTNVNSITLTTGHTYIISAHLDFPSNATGRRGLYVSATSGSSTGINASATATQMATDGAATRMTCTFITRLTSTSTLYLNALQASGSSLNVTSYIDAVMIA